MMMRAMTPTPTPATILHARGVAVDQDVRVMVVERIPLATRYATPDGALVAGQAYEDAAHDNAHGSEGYVTDATFSFDPGGAGEASALVVTYRWESARAFCALIESEEDVLAGWLAEYAAGPREVTLSRELAVQLK